MQKQLLGKVCRKCEWCQNGRSADLVTQWAKIIRSLNAYTTEPCGRHLDLDIKHWHFSNVVILNSIYYQGV